MVENINMNVAVTRVTNDDNDNVDEVDAVDCDEVKVIPVVEQIEIEPTLDFIEVTRKEETTQSKVHLHIVNKTIELKNKD